ncbi:zinc-binding dehydrogenase [Bifidobacterium imperatoris]|uniref:Quinone oxidoreductase n=1 Tax=Bifidobacterium imperatoris TaxID=2020965 RepID=A0A2N5IS79_9BIFI|nr:zinc-binding dehydrogenase [Bifidobacterium imperatoris]PLS24814.1 quinone oxidoreductase [Bifidobacterium imperatoris]QSY57969.1 zinc-binding dehydrogenase [Bifidobacterium imperatoris]
MKAVYASTVNNENPLSALAVGDQPAPAQRPYWSTVSVRAVSVNHHDLWSLKGVGLSAEQTPMILGTDAVGVLDEDIPGKHGLKAGNEVVLYTFVGTDGNGVMPGERRSILSEKYPGTMAEKTAVPSANVFAKPSNLSVTEAAALGTSWLTAYSLLFNAAGIKPGDSVLIQGAGGGVSTAAVQLAHAAGLEVFVTSRDAEKRAKAMELGADAAFESGVRLPRKVDAVIESVGAATWSHSIKSVRPGGTIAICGATTGDQPGAELTRIFFQDIRIQGSTMGSREDFGRLLRFIEHNDIHPVIDSVFAGLDAAPEAFAKLNSGDVFGKVVIEL